jgi:hypothetical protein
MFVMNGQIRWMNDPTSGKQDLRFGTWNVRSLCKACSLMPVETEVAQNQQANIHFSMERGTRIKN